MSDPNYRSGFDSYPEDFDKNGNLKPEAAKSWRSSTNPDAGSRPSGGSSSTYGGDRGPPSHYHPDGTKKSALD